MKVVCKCLHFFSDKNEFEGAWTRW